MKECVTHHYACDCREREFERTKQELEAALAIIQRQERSMSLVLEGVDTLEKQLADAKAQINQLTYELDSVTYANPETSPSAKTQK